MVGEGIVGVGGVGQEWWVGLGRWAGDSTVRQGRDGMAGENSGCDAGRVTWSQFWLGDTEKRNKNVFFTLVSPAVCVSGQTVVRGGGGRACLWTEGSNSRRGTKLWSFSPRRSDASTLGGGSTCTGGRGAKVRANGSS